MNRSWLLALVLVSGLTVGEAVTARVLRQFQTPATPECQPLDDALGQGSIQRAFRACGDSYRAAVASGSWEALVEVGDAAQRLGEVAGSPEGVDAKARQLYRSALTRARRQESLDGVLRVAEAFATLGDREGVEQSFQVAEALAAHDPEAQADVRAAATRFSDLFPSGGRRGNG